MKRVGATIRGFGDYKISNNTILQGGMSPPMITNSVSNGGVIIRHREYIRDIQAATNFTNQVFPLNPGIQSSFPWLAQIAPAFEQYRFRGIVFEFKSTSADVVLSGAASTALGTVVMGTQYDVLDPPFTNKFEMQNWEFTTSNKPSHSFMHPVECAKSQTPLTMLYIRSADPPVNSDKRLYDLGNFNIAVVGMQNVNDADPDTPPGNIGELWVTYEVEFFKPKLEEDITTQFAHFTYIQPSDGKPKLDPPGTGKPFGRHPAGVPLNTLYPPPPQLGSGLDVKVDVTNNRLILSDCIGKTLMLNMYWYWGAGITPLSAFIDPPDLYHNNFPPAPGVGPYPGILLQKINLAQTSYVQWAKDLPPVATNPTVVPTRMVYNAMFSVTEDIAYIQFQSPWTWVGNGASNYDIWIVEIGNPPVNPDLGP